MTQTGHILQFFSRSYADRDIHEVSAQCAELADYMAEMLPPNPETTAGLRKLLEARECFMRSMELKSKAT